MLRERNPEKRQRILDAALKVFATRGFYNARVSEVAAEAGVADGTIYLYFENKDDLLISLFEERMQRLIVRANEEIARTDGTPLDKIRRLIQLHLNLVGEDPDLAEFITVELRQSGKFVKEYDNPKFTEYLRIFRDLVVAGQHDGVIRRTVDARLVVRAIFGALDELLLTLSLTSRNRSVDLNATADGLADIFFDGIRPAPAAEQGSNQPPAGAGSSGGQP
jgi:TetR/AcrR family fatty acid metabolism transcriptional regulator